jgi:hypothetical protein
VEALVYSADGSLNQRSIAKVDASGNEIERTSFDQNDKPRTTSFYTYEFDSHGNWIKRTTSKPGQEGKPEAQYVDFRTITYW